MSQCSDSFYQDKRLLHHLISSKTDLGKVVTAYRQSLTRYIQPDMPIVIDMTDLAKRRAKKMKYLALARDSSEGKLVTGFEEIGLANSSSDDSLLRLE